MFLKIDANYGSAVIAGEEVIGPPYAMDTIENHGTILQDAGFAEIELTDASNWYREEVRREYELLKGELNGKVVELIGQESADHFVENWRAIMVVCEKGEMQQVYLRAKKG